MEPTTTTAALTVTGHHGSMTFRLDRYGDPENVIPPIADWWRAQRTARRRPDAIDWIRDPAVTGRAMPYAAAEQGATWRYLLRLPHPATPAPYPGTELLVHAETRTGNRPWTVEHRIAGEDQLLIHSLDGPLDTTPVRPPARPVATRTAPTDPDLDAD